MADQYPRRANTDLRENSMQYNSPRGNIPHRVAQATAAAAPPPKPPTRSKYPREYRNQEGNTENPRIIFEPWETRGGTAKAPTKYTECPVAPQAVQRFDYNRRCASAAKVDRPVHPNDRKRLVQTPPNDAGVLRVITVQGKPDQVMGTIYHPEDNKHGFQRSMIQPLDRVGRQTVQELREYEMRKTQTMKAQRR
ncbi:hypothetical protein PG989_000959 [Apiospora arundinis]